MLVENKKDSGRWPGCLSRKDWDSIINIQAKVEIEKRYSKEIQSLGKTSCFGATPDGGTVDQEPLEEIVKVASSKAPLLSSMVFVKRSEEKWRKKACVSRQDNNIISSLLNLLKERADSLIKYIFASAIFHQKISKSSKLLCHDKKQKHS